MSLVITIFLRPETLLYEMVLMLDNTAHSLNLVVGWVGWVVEVMVMIRPREHLPKSSFTEIISLTVNVILWGQVRI